MRGEFRNFSEIVESQDVESIIEVMEKSKLNEPYMQLLKFVGGYSGRDDLDLSDFYGLAHCVYGWMPRMLFLEEKLDLEILNQEWKSDEEGKLDYPDNEFYPEFLKLCGNSIVGLSKLLHFAYPEKFAIIDSNVYKALKGKDTSMPNGIEKRIPLYRNYMEWTSGINESNEVLGKIRKKAKSLNELSKNRFIEFFLYNVGKELGEKV